MSATRLVQPTFKLVLTICALATLEGCTTWRVQPGSPAQLVEQRRPSQVQLHGHDGARVVLDRPWVDGDSIVGLQHGDTTHMAVGDVSKVAVRRFDWLETTALTVVTTGAVFGIACAAACDIGPFLAE